MNSTNNHIIIENDKITTLNNMFLSRKGLKITTSGEDSISKIKYNNLLREYSELKLNYNKLLNENNQSSNKTLLGKLVALTEENKALHSEIESIKYNKTKNERFYKDLVSKENFSNDSLKEYLVNIVTSNSFLNNKNNEDILKNILGDDFDFISFLSFKLESQDKSIIYLSSLLSEFKIDLLGLIDIITNNISSDILDKQVYIKSLKYSEEFETSLEKLDNLKSKVCKINDLSTVFNNDYYYKLVKIKDELYKESYFDNNELNNSKNNSSFVKEIKTKVFSHRNNSLIENYKSLSIENLKYKDIFLLLIQKCNNLDSLLREEVISILSNTKGNNNIIDFSNEDMINVLITQAEIIENKINKTC